jgi:polyisoprenoid-binding protein YceI
MKMTGTMRTARAVAALVLGSVVGSTLISAVLTTDSRAADKPAADSVPAPSTAPVPAGAYTLDKSHTSLVFRVDHLSFSKYTGRFTKLDAKLQFDPANPDKSTLTVDIDPRSIDADGAPAGFMATLAGKEWLDADRFPKITYRSTKVEKVGANGLRITGDFTLHGITKPVVLNAKYNGGYASHPFEPNARIGFSATGKLKRTDFGIAYGIPAPGTTMGVGDDVEIIIETEFSGPPQPDAAKGGSAPK